MEKKVSSEDKEKKVSSLEDLERIARKIVGEGKTISKRTFKDEGVNEPTFKNYAPEGYDWFKNKYGYEIDRRSKRYTEDELLPKIDEFISKYNREPTWFSLVRETKVSAKVWEDRFGKIPKIMSAYREWLKKSNPKSKNLKLVDEYLEKKEKTLSRKSKSGTRKKSSKTDEVVLNFGNMVYAPEKEQGVVFLFSVLCKHLGFLVEKIQQGYPDCKAKTIKKGRRLGTDDVNIEFEFESKQYPIDHKKQHEEIGCDIIVCWEDNWEDPYEGLEIISLKSEIEEIKRGRKEFHSA